eukprot:TRINITY_DN35466_c0_g1_i1.p3 TRINITY_DN35466_c0_g1~~TRINITY_DN35466_c0_g1_i1.p3  ORF type:complete len:155 (+),score=18.59 TRINITY_DN35466_c0_g1_i1:2-466(+)
MGILRPASAPNLDKPPLSRSPVPAVGLRAAALRLERPISAPVPLPSNASRDAPPEYLRAYRDQFGDEPLASRPPSRFRKRRWMTKEEFAAASREEQREEILRMLYWDRKAQLEDKIVAEVSAMPPVEFPPDVHVQRLVGRHQSNQSSAGSHQSH